VPQGDVPGEMYSPTQPIPTKPPPYGHQGVSVDDLIDFTPALHEEALKFVQNYQIGPIFTPPIESKPGGKIAALLSPGNQGGTNWPGGAYDPVTHMLYVFSQSTVQANSVVQPDPANSDMRYVSGRAGVPGRGRGGAAGGRGGAGRGGRGGGRVPARGARVLLRVLPSADCRCSSLLTGY